MIDEIMKDAEEHMKKAIEALHRSLQSIRTGRASPALVERITVEYYGTQTPINQLASITTPEGRLVQIQPWDKSSLGAIEKAIQKSELGLNPNNDGNVIRIAVPPLTEQRRREMVKLIKGHVEESRVSLRNIRRSALSDLKVLEDENEITEDDQKRAGEKVQQLLDRYVRQAEDVGDSKESEVMEV